MAGTGVIIIIVITTIIPSISGEIPFAEFKKRSLEDNPVREAAKKVRYGRDAIQPYYICDDPAGSVTTPLSAWHYSCKQSCLEENEKSKIGITRASWHYVGKDVPTYKVTTNEVCYTSHENMWGYCSHSQTITPVETLPSDLGKIPPEFLQSETPIPGIRNIVNSGPGECEYFSDNRRCARDYVITYRPGKTSRKSDSDSLMLNIYGDGIRVNPEPGTLFQNDVAWFWNPKFIKGDEFCGWTLYGDTTCRITKTSDIMECPDIGYQYNIHSLKSAQTCKGEIYDIEGPAPFVYKGKSTYPNRTETLNKAAEGKGDPDVHMIMGINNALDEIEETYCSASCDLFSREPTKDDDYVMDTPIGSWRIHGANTPDPRLVPCQATSSWKMKSPTTMCHGRNHVLVEDSNTHHTCSWDTTKDYITSEEVCNDPNNDKGIDVNDARKRMSAHQNITLDFWTGDRVVLAPPYDHPVWVNHSTSYSRNPGWFSKVTLTKDMLHNQDDISHLLTVMAENMKQEIQYNKTSSKTMKAMFIEEVFLGIGSAGNSLMRGIFAVLGVVPKFVILLLVAIVGFIIVKGIIGFYLKEKLSRKFSLYDKRVTFDPMTSDHEATVLSSQGRRPKSRSSRLSRAMSEMDL